MDISGGIFLTLSLIFKEEFDVLAAVSLSFFPPFTHISSCLDRPTLPLIPKKPTRFLSLLSDQVNYLGIVVLELGIVSLAAILNPRANRRRRRRAAEAATADDAEKGAGTLGSAESPVDTPSTANDGSTGELGEEHHHRDVGAISGTGREGAPDLGNVEGVVGKNRAEEREEKEMGHAREKVRVDREQ